VSDETPRSILNEDGSCDEKHRAMIPDEDLVALLETLILNRVIDRRFLALQRQGRLGFYMTSTGEEATTIGAAYCLASDDPIFLTYRELGALLWRGIPLELLLNQLIGNSQDLCHGRQMPIHFCYRDWSIPSVSSPVGTQLPHACGYAYAARLRGTGQVSLAFLGEGTASQGDFHTALNFSGVFRVPAVYVIRNNGYAISTPESLQTAAGTLASRAQGYGLPGVRVDGNDFVAVVAVLREAVERARGGEGPTLVEALTYRMGAHSTADDPSAYRSAEEPKQWERLDPLARMAAHARWRGLFDEDAEAEAWSRAEQRVQALVADCERWPPPALETLFEDVTHERAPQLEDQRRRFKRYQLVHRKARSEIP
jgi:2-oxoisovalerate dehydrogenase E1 component alpha subunit